MASQTHFSQRPLASTQTLRPRKPGGRRAYWRRARHTGVTYVVLLVLALVFLAPFAWLVDISLKQLEELAMFPIQWLPQQWNWGNFAAAINTIPFWQDAQTSLFLSLIN